MRASFNSRSPSGLRHGGGGAYPRPSNVSIHAAQAGCDPKKYGAGLKLSTFQFTQPKRAATCSFVSTTAKHFCFNSRSPSGLRHCPCCHLQGLGDVSIHAAQAGCDAVACGRGAQSRCFNSRSPSGLRLIIAFDCRCNVMFQFTQPKRAATLDEVGSRASGEVSIHAAQAGCDCQRLVRLKG